MSEQAKKFKVVLNRHYLPYAVGLKQPSAAKVLGSDEVSLFDQLRILALFLHGMLCSCTTSAGRTENS